MIGTRECTIIGLFLAVLLLPLLFAHDDRIAADADRTLVVMTPHNEQIRYEFKRAFEEWHRSEHGEDVAVAWSVPGGTSEIRRMLIDQWEAALEQGRQPGGDSDLVFGGGSYEHGVLAKDVQVTVGDLSADQAKAWLEGIGLDAARAQALCDHGGSFEQGAVKGMVEVGDEITIAASASISTPGPIDPDTLESRYGRSDVGGTPLWSADGKWYGTALSSFGIVANTDELRLRDIEPPDSWVDLADPRMMQSVSLVNPAQSGSVTTAFETILKRYGWTRGWQVLRRVAANARTISASSLRGPTDVASGDAVMGVCIDFFGRYQQQALADHGEGGRIIYVDPPGETMLDPDPISMLANPPDAELAGRFIEFTLTDQGQALWQFDPAAASDDGLGPEMFALRRLPILQSMYDRHLDRFMDPVDPFENAAPPEHPDRNMRSFIAPLMLAMAMDHRDALSGAWTRIASHPSYPEDATGIVTARDVDDPELEAMLERFDAMPDITAPDGTVYRLDTPEGRKAVKYGWLRGQWGDEGPWDPEASPSAAFRRHVGVFFDDAFAPRRPTP